MTAFLETQFAVKLDPVLDFASLTYTIHHVCARELKWSFPFDRPLNVSSEDLEYRRTRVCDWLSKDEEKEDQQRLVPQRFLTELKNACCCPTKINPR
jgi:hypothetical protein